MPKVIFLGRGIATCAKAPIKACPEAAYSNWGRVYTAEMSSLAVLVFPLPQDDATGVKGNPMYSAKCIRRKVTKIENGRPYYQDTNNSAADFLRDQPLTPGETPTSVDE